MPKIFSGKRVAVIIDSKFIPLEIEAYKNAFLDLGAEVIFASRIWYGDNKPGNPHWKSPMFQSDVGPNEQEPWEPPQRLRVGER